MSKIKKDLDKLTDEEIADMVAQDLYDAERTVEIKIAEEERKQFAKEEEARAKEFEKLPKDLGAGDTMTREEIWMSIGHMLGMNEDVQERRDMIRTGAGIKVGKRKKAPKYER